VTLNNRGEIKGHSTIPSSRTLSDGERESFTYNQQGQEATHTDFDGNVATYGYYSSFGNGAYTGSLQQVVYTPGAGAAPGATPQTVVYTYDAMGRQSTITDASGTATNSYDAQGNLVEQQTPEGTIFYKFDPAMGEHTETYTADTDTRYGYNTQDELTSVTVKMLNGTTLSTPLATSYVYDAVGNLHTQTLPDGEVTTYGYDDENRLTSQVETQNGVTLFSQSFILNDDGTRHSASEAQVQPGGGTVSTSTAWGYDADQRLISEAYTSNAPTSEGYTTTYGYDLAGNRITETHTGPGDGATETINYSYNGDDQLTQQVSNINGATIFTYDLNGSQQRTTREKERAMGFEPTTSALGRLHSTTELRPQMNYAADELRPQNQSVFHNDSVELSRFLKHFTAFDKTLDHAIAGPVIMASGQSGERMPRCLSKTGGSATGG
jgi:YD repeat-containing protein